jgi:GH24 family phage-related lysozyme (muramidase)
LTGLRRRTLRTFAELCANEGLDLSAAGVNHFKDDHQLGNSGPVEGMIGPQTAGVYYHVLLGRLSVPAGAGRHINQAGLDLVKEFEGLARRIQGDPGHVAAYLDSVGVPTIGYGHTRGVHLGQVISIAQAEQFLREDMAESEGGVTRMVTVTVSDNEFAALVSFVFNLGPGALKHSTLLRRLNQGNKPAAADEFLKWNRAGGQVLAGLTRRREAERALFLS